jgi:hypothetical protein
VSKYAAASIEASFDPALVALVALTEHLCKTPGGALGNAGRHVWHGSNHACTDLFTCDFSRALPAW